VSRQKIVPATSRIHASKWAISRHIGQMDYALNWRQQANALIELPCAIRKTITSAGRGLAVSVRVLTFGVVTPLLVRRPRPLQSFYRHPRSHRSNPKRQTPAADRHPQQCCHHRRRQQTFGFITQGPHGQTPPIKKLWVGLRTWCSSVVQFFSEGGVNLQS
jgi:hypothetical protein